MISQILIKNGKIVNHNRTFIADILIKDGSITKIGKDLDAHDYNVKIISADKKYVIPGGIDPHVHLELESNGRISSDSFESGSIAAVSGGTTTLIDFVTPEREENIIDAFKKRLILSENSFCDVSFHMSITSIYKGIESDVKRTIKELGIFSFKLYMAYKGIIGLNGKDILRAMELIKKYRGIALLHCEDGDSEDFLKKKLKSDSSLSIKNYASSRPPLIESEAVSRALLFGKITGCPVYLVHISAEESIPLIRAYRERGTDVIAETCPHYLLLDESVYEETQKISSRFLMCPPLRKKSSRDVLWDAISDGLLEVVSTDHCPFNGKGKENDFPDDFTSIPKGVGSVEYRLKLLYSEGVLKNKITMNRFVNLVSTRPAKIFGLYPRKGTIQPGSDADLVIWDPAIKERISLDKQFQNCDSNIYEGTDIMGGPETVIKGGRIVFEKGLFDISSPKGRYIKRFR